MKTFAHFSEWLNCLQDFQTLVRYIFSKGAIYYVKDIGNFKIWRPNIHSDCHVYIIRFRKYQSCSLSIPLIAKKTPQTINYIWIMKTTFNMIKVFYLCCIECCEHSPDQGGRRWLPSGNPWLTHLLLLINSKWNLTSYRIYQVTWFCTYLILINDRN